jgi:hypothetical protein
LSCSWALFLPTSGVCGVRPPTRSSLPSCSRPSRTLRAADAVARRRAILDRHCARRHEVRAGRGGRMVPIEPKDGTRAGVDWWVSVKDLTPTPPSEPLKPSTGAAVRDHRNAVRDRSESLSAIDRNHCPHSPESAYRRSWRRPGQSVAASAECRRCRTRKSGPCSRFRQSPTRQSWTRSGASRPPASPFEPS